LTKTQQKERTRPGERLHRTAAPTPYPRSHSSAARIPRFNEHAFNWCAYGSLLRGAVREAGNLRATKSYSTGVQLWSGLYVVRLDTAFAVLSPKSF